MTLSQFRAAFPAFKDPQVWPDGEIEFWLDIATKQLNVNRWADIVDLGQGLYAAHMLTLGRREAEAKPGSAGAIGVLNSKSVGAVSAGYDTQLGIEEDGGFWNTTSYGVRFLRYAKMVGMGGTQLGGPDVVLGPSFGPPWPGVINNP